MKALLDPRAVAVVGASPRPGAGSRVIANLRDAGFRGEIYAVNPRYADVLGYKCVPSVRDLPDAVECLVIAVAAEIAVGVLEEAQARGIPAAVVLSAGFGEGGQLQERAQRVRAVAEKGMAICGPNCFGIVNVKAGAAMFSGVLPKGMEPGKVAIISQSGSLGNFAFSPLIRDRKLGFSHFISCGNQIGTTTEDYVDWLVDDPDVTVIACIVEALKNPSKLARAARRAHAQRKSLVFFHIGTSAVGKAMVRSHTGALAGDAEIMRAFLRRCGIAQADTYDQFVEAIELLAIAPFDETLGDEVVVVSGSGGSAAVAADCIEQAGIQLAALTPTTQEKVRAVLPEFGSATNPIDATGVAFDDPALLPALYEAMFSQPGRPIIATTVNVVGVDRIRRLAGVIAETARKSGRTIVSYQTSPLGPLDEEIVRTLHGAGIPVLMGIQNAMGVLKFLPQRRDVFSRAAPAASGEGVAPTNTAPLPQDFLCVRQRLVAANVPVVEAALASSAQEAVVLMRKFARPVALKAEAAGLMHKSDLGCVKLNCASEADVLSAYDDVVANARKAGCAPVGVLMQPMVSGIAECFAGVIDDPLYGPAIVFGLGGVFVELMRETVTEMAPLDHDDAMRMITSVKGWQILTGARGRQPGDIGALADCLVNLSRFAIANTGRFRALDLNPIIVMPKGVIAVDIAIEPVTVESSQAHREQNL